MTIYYIYIKTHNKTGLKYLGQTKQEQDGNNMEILIGTKEQIHQGAQTSISKGELNNLFDL